MQHVLTIDGTSQCWPG